MARSAAVPGSRVPTASPEITLAHYYDLILADPMSAVKALDERKAAGLSQIVTDYHALLK